MASSNPDASSNLSDPPEPPTALPPPVNAAQELHSHKRVPSPPQSSKQADSEIKPTILEGIQTIRPYDFTGVHLRPCSRESLLTGIGTGFGIGGLRFIIGGTQFKAMNWAVGAFCITSIGAYAICQEKRKLEKAAMERVKEAIDEKKRKKLEELRSLRDQKRKEEEEKKKNESWTGWVGWGGDKK